MFNLKGRELLIHEAYCQQHFSKGIFDYELARIIGVVKAAILQQLHSCLSGQAWRNGMGFHSRMPIADEMYPDHIWLNAETVERLCAEVGAETQVIDRLFEGGLVCKRLATPHSYEYTIDYTRLDELYDTWKANNNG